MERTDKTDLDSADEEELMRRAGVDRPTAHDICVYRDTHGGFRDWAEVESPASVDSVVLRRLRERFTLHGAEPAAAAQPPSA